MGVAGLWELLSPAGRRVAVESLGDKTVAIDASIWLVQFVKAYRDKSGDPMKNAHLIGLFRRLCKLLFFQIRPVLVFDGATPTLKKRTVAARRRQSARPPALFVFASTIVFQPSTLFGSRDWVCCVHALAEGEAGELAAEDRREAAHEPHARECFGPRRPHDWRWT